MTIPQVIREHLHLRPGDKLEFVIQDDQEVTIRPPSVDIRELRGMLAHKVKRPVTVEEMRQHLGVGAEGTVVIHDVADGAILLTTGELPQPALAEDLLDSLVTGVGAAAERLGVRDEDHLDTVVDRLREQTFAERYGSEQAAAALN
jgi:AbrB family looped-hinge helix DNA binding protein